MKAAKITTAKAAAPEVVFTGTKEAQFGGWVEGTCNALKFQAKIFDEGSDYGIDGGRVSKLWITENGRMAANYDRGWDHRPSKHIKAEYKAILQALNFYGSEQECAGTCPNDGSPEA